MSETRSYPNWTRRKFLRTSTALAGMTTTAAFWRPKSLLGATPSAGGTLRVSVDRQVDFINPLKAGDNSEYMLAEMTYSGLTRIGADMVPRPDVAESWTANEDASEFVFKLKQGIKFHHGPELVAKDVVATIKAILDPESASPGRKNIGPIVDVGADDDYTVRVKLDGPFADLPTTLGHPNARIAPANILENDYAKLDTEEYGCGPFKVVEYDPARVTKLVKYDGYHVPNRPYLDAVEQYLYPDLAGESAALINGETDVMLLVAPPDFNRISESRGIVGRRQPTGRFLNLVLRMDQKPFDDKRVRQAMSVALDRELLVELVLEGFGRPAYDNPISPEYQFYIETPKPQYDPAKAKQLLAEAGYPNGVKLELLCSTKPPTRTQLGVAVKEMAKAAGFDIDVKTVPHDNYIANVWRKAGFYVGSWNMRPTEDSMFTLLLTTDGPWADTAWNNKTFDGLVDQARRTIDRNKRAELYAEAQRLLVDDVPYVLPFYQDVLTAHAEYVMDYTMHPLQVSYFLDEAWLGEGAPKR